MPIRNIFNRDANNNPSSAALRIVGAVVPVEIYVPQAIAQVLTQNAQPLPTPVIGFAMMDTGANGTCVHEPSLTTLGLNPIDVVPSGTAGGPVQQNVYPARLVFPSLGWELNFARLTGVNLTGQIVPSNPPQQLLVLVGRDILESAILVWNGPGGAWSIAW